MNSSSIHNFDERRNVALPGDHDKTIEFAVNHFISIAQDAIESKGGFYVALSGGSTPKKIFEMLALPKYREAIHWPSVFLFWGDERAVGPDHPDSNYKMAMDSGFSKLSVPKSQIFRMKAESDIKENAKEYEMQIKKNLRGKGFDLVMLGMGDDGHTASLFPGTKALDITDHLVVANEVPQKKCWRMTFTYTLINDAHNIALYVMGEGKQERLVDVLTDKTNSFPSARVGTPSHKAVWIVDDDASKELLKKWSPKGNSNKKAI